MPKTGPIVQKAIVIATLRCDKVRAVIEAKDRIAMPINSRGAIAAKDAIEAKDVIEAKVRAVNSSRGAITTPNSTDASQIIGANRSRRAIVMTNGTTGKETRRLKNWSAETRDSSSISKN